MRGGTEARQYSCHSWLLRASPGPRLAQDIASRESGDARSAQRTERATARQYSCHSWLLRASPGPRLAQDIASRESGDARSAQRTERATARQYSCHSWLLRASPGPRIILGVASVRRRASTGRKRSAAQTASHRLPTGQAKRGNARGTSGDCSSSIVARRWLQRSVGARPARRVIPGFSPSGVRRRVAG